MGSEQCDIAELYDNAETNWDTAGNIEIFIAKNNPLRYQQFLSNLITFNNKG